MSHSPRRRIPSIAATRPAASHGSPSTAKTIVSAPTDRPRARTATGALSANGSTGSNWARCRTRSTCGCASWPSRTFVTTSAITAKGASSPVSTAPSRTRSSTFARTSIWSGSTCLAPGPQCRPRVDGRGWLVSQVRQQADRPDCPQVQMGRRRATGSARRMAGPASGDRAQARTDDRA